jgi:hypothetical protein
MRHQQCQQLQLPQGFPEHANIDVVTESFLSMLADWKAGLRLFWHMRGRSTCGGFVFTLVCLLLSPRPLSSPVFDFCEHALLGIGVATVFCADMASTVLWICDMVRIIVCNRLWKTSLVSLPRTRMFKHSPFDCISRVRARAIIYMAMWFVVACVFGAAVGVSLGCLGGRGIPESATGIVTFAQLCPHGEGQGDLKAVRIGEASHPGPPGPGTPVGGERRYRSLSRSGRRRV